MSLMWCTVSGHQIPQGSKGRSFKVEIESSGPDCGPQWADGCGLRSRSLGEHAGTLSSSEEASASELALGTASDLEAWDAT